MVDNPNWKKSAGFRIGILYAMLALINITFFTVLVYENQTDLLRENFQLRAAEFGHRLQNGLKRDGGKMPEFSKSELVKSLHRFGVKNYIIFDERGQILSPKREEKGRVDKRTLERTYQLRRDDILNANHLIELDENNFRAEILLQLSSSQFLRGNISLGSVRERLYRLHLQTGLAVAWGVLFHLLFAVFVYRIIFLRLGVMKSAVKSMTLGNLSARAVWKRQGGDEIDLMGSAFNEMAERIEKSIKTLQTALKRVKTLKIKQDADYFLTSLLIKPLAVNRGASEFAAVDFVTEQKKAFKFQKWESQIGGDISISHSINLRGRNYLAIVNADAMGKSIQGAGGALVLGVIFNSIVNRNQETPEDRDQSPEEWLRACFQEIHHLFLTFDGSMFVSAFMGLLDEEEGELFFINAEHPATVLYRDGLATYLLEEVSLHKLGVPFQGDRFTVNQLRLLPGDVIITGSDGRDDLAMGKDQDGTRIMNTSSALFLDCVTKSRANLTLLQGTLSACGLITDDLSLVRLEYSGSSEVYEPSIESIQEIQVLS